jgi:hypothetical protein
LQNHRHSEPAKELQDTLHNNKTVDNLFQNTRPIVNNFLTAGSDTRSLSGATTGRWLSGEEQKQGKDRFRRVLIRWEKKEGNDIALLHLACAYITFKHAALLG